jgi:hypothetical protein
MNAEIVALRVKLYNVERDLEDSKADYVKLAHLVCDLWHSSAAAYIPPWLQKRVRDVSHAQSVEEQRFLHGAAAVTGPDTLLQEIAMRALASGPTITLTLDEVRALYKFLPGAPGCIAQEASP